MFVTFEGIDGAGKSTQAELLAAALGPEALLLREPGGTPAGERLRAILKDPDAGLSPRTELLLFLAARAELVASAIRPALEAGRPVICDRFIDSTVAYQGAGRGLGVEVAQELNRFAVAGCVPDHTVLLRIPAAEAAARGRRRGDYGVDRFEAEGDRFRAAVAAAFDELAASEPERFVVVDAVGSPEQVHGRVRDALELEP
jgi:dTMP kinase